MSYNFPLTRMFFQLSALTANTFVWTTGNTMFKSKKKLTGWYVIYNIVFTFISSITNEIHLFSTLKTIFLCCFCFGDWRNHVLDYFYQWITYFWLRLSILDFICFSQHTKGFLPGVIRVKFIAHACLFLVFTQS